MPRKEVYELHPTGWEQDPADEFFKLQLLDYCVGQVYTNYTLFFKLSDDEKPKTIPVLKRGLEVTLSQCRQLCGDLETHPDGGLCFHKKRESTVQFHVQWLDGPEDEGKYPSLEELEKQHYTTQALGDLDTWCVSPMTYGEKPEASPNHGTPKGAAFKASFVRGGLVFVMMHHHYANDIMGWAGEMWQLAENCAAIFKSPESPALPPWDAANLDLSRFIKPSPPAEQMVDGPPEPPRDPAHRVGQWLWFHLPKSKMAELKKAASPEDGSYWISSHDAYSAMIWRMLSKHRARLFKPDLSKSYLWGEAVDMRKRLASPAPPKRLQSNIINVPMSLTMTATPALTAAEVISDAPLSKLAWYNRQLTKSATPEAMEGMLGQIAAVRDKTALFLRMDSFPPMSNITTDWRDCVPCDADFGFAKPIAFRHPFPVVTPGYIIIFPPRTNGGPAGADEGNEFLIGFEKEITKDLVEDPEWNKYFEFRGVDVEEKISETAPLPV
ncbi:hypothetical protein GGR56DRAFT_659519 [Xylariaceae sp. FL0804]|nr:hypothetical protein GGR56DRAFT_659519 [Xylariaceae sp. FL0804]